jgi:hypothetical protein
MSITSSVFAGARAARRVRDIQIYNVPYLNNYPSVADLFKAGDQTAKISRAFTKEHFNEIEIAHQDDNVTELIFETSDTTAHEWIKFSDYFWLCNLAVTMHAELDIERAADLTGLACKDVVEEYLMDIKII